LHRGGKQLTPNGVGIRNPTFDVTPAKFIATIMTERGVLRAPFGELLKAMGLTS
jgi:methylthioribose-1-phosphate isomerase